MSGSWDKAVIAASILGIGYLLYRSVTGVADALGGIAGTGQSVLEKIEKTNVFSHNSYLDDFFRRNTQSYDDRESKAIDYGERTIKENPGLIRTSPGGDQYVSVISGNEPRGVAASAYYVQTRSMGSIPAPSMRQFGNKSPVSAIKGIMDMERRGGGTVVKNFTPPAAAVVSALDKRTPLQKKMGVILR